MKATFKLSPQSVAQIKQDLKILSLDNKRKKQIVRESAKAIKKEALQNKNKQQTAEGKAWQARARPKLGKRGKPLKMLQKMYNRTGFYAKNAESGILGFRNKVDERIAAEHHYGLAPKRAKSQTPKQGNATEAQAQALLKAGFNEPNTPVDKHKSQKRKDGKLGMALWAKNITTKSNTRRTSSVGYIMQNLTGRQADVLLKLLTKKDNTGAKGNQKLPARPAYNFNDAHNANIVKKQIDTVIKIK